MFSIVQLWRLVFLEPLGVQRCHVPHFKGLIYDKVELEAQGRDSTFAICHVLVKKAILHLKRGFVQTHLLTIVRLNECCALQMKVKCYTGSNAQVLYQALARVILPLIVGRCLSLIMLLMLALRDKVQSCVRRLGIRDSYIIKLCCCRLCSFFIQLDVD